MKGLWRIIFNGLTMLSLVLCAGVAGSWVRSYQTVDSILNAVSQTHTEQHLNLEQGGVIFTSAHQTQVSFRYQQEDEGIHYRTWPAHRSQRGDWWLQAIQFWSNQTTPNRHDFGIIIPHWFLLALSAVLPATRSAYGAGRLFVERQTNLLAQAGDDWPACRMMRG
jgi:hypothetical protein